MPTLPTDVARAVHQGVDSLLKQFDPEQESPVALPVQQAVFLARELQRRAVQLQTPAERRQQAELDRMIQSNHDKATLIEMTDQAFRARLPHRSADQLIHILDVQGIPRFFSTVEQAMLKGFQSFGAHLPGVAMPLVKERMQHETANVVLPAEEDLLRAHLAERRQEGVRMNVNLLGEALLGETDARRRLQRYLDALARPEIEVISVKISTIYSQISALARRHAVEVLCDRLELLYRAAAKHRFTRSDGAVVAKFVYLDMEEYRDKEITAEVFMQTLDRPGLEQVRAGIALQSYLPDSFASQQQITAWARRRVESGGAPVTIRIVKGANMEMERVDASLHGWPLATFTEKIDTDANYLRMLQFGMQSDNLAAVRLGIASHNLFTLAYGLVLAASARAVDHVQFEMLEGMANHQRRALFDLSKNLLLYAPACRQEDFINAIGYLVRRLDENTGADNFLRHAFSLEVDDPQWQRLEQSFMDAFARIDRLPIAPFRNNGAGDRFHDQRAAEGIRPPHPPSAFPLHSSPFENVADTDWSLPQNGQWAEEIVDRWQDRCGNQAMHVPLVIAGEEIDDGRRQRESNDPSRPELIVARWLQANADDVQRAVSCAAADPDHWRKIPVEQRREILQRVADELAAQRGELMGAMLADGGKTLAESDPEVSEAIDFCRFYGDSAQQWAPLDGVSVQGKGVVAVVSPWNFPLAIPCGGVAAALAAGNCVILKPASDTVLTAYALCVCFWRAGVPKSALQFLPCSGATGGQQLVSHKAVNAVILTGGTATARRMLAHQPSMNLLAETGGKNATIVTALADRDLAIKNVLHSAFSHSGQKCSATSLLILEDEVYEDAQFRDALCDAVESQTVGSAWELPTKIGPLIRPPSGDLENGLKELEAGERWAVMPRLHVDGNPHLVAPGVKWGVQPASYTHCTEFFGPILGVMRAKDLHAAIDLVNATGYGLTSGLESLDDREHRLWQEGIRAGNLYINRPTTGAIVLRQPFGGMGKSAVGPGVKAGGPNYVATLMDFNATNAGTAPSQGAVGLPTWPAFRAFCAAVHNESLTHAVANYESWAEEEFLSSHDHFQLLGEDNIRRYIPMRALRVRVHPDDSQFEIFARACAARAAGCRTTVSSPPDLPASVRERIDQLDVLTDDWAADIEFIEETDHQLASVLAAGQTDRVRYAAPDRVPAVVRSAAATALEYLADAPVSPHGRIELLWYFREQSVSHVYHRYGNLGTRSTQR